MPWTPQTKPGWRLEYDRATPTDAKMAVALVPPPFAAQAVTALPPSSRKSTTTLTPPADVQVAALADGATTVAGSRTVPTPTTARASARAIDRLSDRTTWRPIL